MSRKTPAPIPHFRPVSQKAYDTFVRRIYAVVPKDNRCADMIDALDMYLDGDRETYAAHLDEHTAITFEMLRFEIDLAIERSARARRPRRRRNIETQPCAAPQPQTTPRPESKVVSIAASQEELPIVPRAETQLDNMTQISNPSTRASETSSLPPRWMRRAAIMSMRPKKKWKKIG